MRRFAGFAAVMALLAAVPAASAGDRANPFAPPLTAEEEAARNRELARAVVREMMPEIEANASGRVSSSLAELEVRLSRRIDDMERNAPPPGGGVPSVPGAPLDPNAPVDPNAPPTAGVPGDPANPAAPANGLPEGSTFISCVNGKALYRASDNTLFQVSGSGTPGVDRCAR